MKLRIAAIRAAVVFMVGVLVLEWVNKLVWHHFIWHSLNPDWMLVYRMLEPLAIWFWLACVAVVGWPALKWAWDAIVGGLE